MTIIHKNIMINLTVPQTVINMSVTYLFNFFQNIQPLTKRKNKTKELVQNYQTLIKICMNCMKIKHMRDLLDWNEHKS